MEKDVTGITPVSIGAKKFQDPTVFDAYIKLLDNNFNQSILLLIDTPKRHNYKAIQGIPEEQALSRIEDHVRTIKNTLRTSLTNTTVTVKRFNALTDEAYQANLTTLLSAYEEDEAFRDDVTQNWVRPFLAETTEPTPQKIHKAKDYFLEEFALLCSISATHNPLIEVYPTKTPLETKLYNHEYSFTDNLILDESRRFWDVDLTDPTKECLGVSDNKRLHAKRRFHEDEHILRLTGPITDQPGRETYELINSVHITPKGKGRFLSVDPDHANARREKTDVRATKEIKPSEQILLAAG